MTDDKRPHQTCEKHDERMLPINGQGERTLTETGLWQCWTCQREFVAVLDRMDGNGP